MNPARPALPDAMRTLTIAAALLLAPAIAAAKPTADEAAWLDGLSSAVVADLAAGKPLVVQVHVPLCDDDIIDCGNAKLGDGDNPSTNLYWATTPGFGYWFTRKKSKWTQVLDGDGATVGIDEVLDVRVYRRRVKASRAWRDAGAPKKFDVYVVAWAWDGDEIDDALAAYAADLYGDAARRLTLDDGTLLDAGGAARIVAYVGHNRLMDLPPYQWPEPDDDAAPKGTIAIACHTAAYMDDEVPAAARVPLLMTRDYLFSNAAPLEGAVLAFAAGGGYGAIRRAAAKAYADVEDKPLDRILGVFTNPAHARWKQE